MLDDDQVVVLRPGSMRVTTLQGKEVEPKELHVDWDLEAAEKGGYPDFMGKEIHEQPRAIADTLLGRLLPDGTVELDELRITDDELRRVDKVFVVACGSSYHAGMVAKYAIERLARLPTEIDIASEFRYRDPVLDERTLVVGVSQSGETIDTLQAMREARQWDAKIMVISNVVDSSMAREADGVLYTRAGPEVGVAATKTHLTQVVALELLALYLAQLRGFATPADARVLFDDLARLPELVETDALARARGGGRRGRRRSSPTPATSSSWDATSGSPSPSRARSSSRRSPTSGPRAIPPASSSTARSRLIVPGTVVVGVATRTHLWEKMMGNVAEVRRGAPRSSWWPTTVTRTPPRRPTRCCGCPKTHPLFAPVLDVVPLQLLAYHIARLHGHNVDRPRNLAKTVTVE